MDKKVELMDGKIVRQRCYSVFYLLGNEKTLSNANTEDFKLGLQKEGICVLDVIPLVCNQLEDKRVYLINTNSHFTVDFE